MCERMQAGAEQGEHTLRFSASCRPQQLSQKNLLRWQSISLALNCRRHAVTDEFCSMSMDRSKKDSSREDTVSHVRHRVSLVRAPSNSWWIIVGREGPAASADAEGACVLDDATVGGAVDIRVAMEDDTARVSH